MNCFSLWRAFRIRHPKEIEEILQFRSGLKCLHLHVMLPSFVQRKEAIYYCTLLIRIQIDFKRTLGPTFVFHNFMKMSATIVSEVKSSWTPSAALRRRGGSWPVLGLSISSAHSPLWPSHTLIKSEVPRSLGWAVRETMVHHRVKELCCTVEESCLIMVFDFEQILEIFSVAQEEY